MDWVRFARVKFRLPLPSLAVSQIPWGDRANSSISRWRGSEFANSDTAPIGKQTLHVWTSHEVLQQELLSSLQKTAYTDLEVDAFIQGSHWLVPHHNDLLYS